MRAVLEQIRASRAAFLIFGGWAAVAGLAVHVLHGAGQVWIAAVDAGALILAVLPQVFFGLLIGACLNQLVPRDMVARRLGEQSGARGLLTSTLLGTITPGGPFASFPIVYALFVAGADVGSLVAYLTAWALLGVFRVVIWELPFIGYDLTLLRWLICLPIPFIAGLIARFIVAHSALKPDKPEQ